LLNIGHGWRGGPTAPIGYDRGALNGGFYLPRSSTFVAAKHRTIRALDLSGDNPSVLADVELDRVIYGAAPSPDGKSVGLITGRFNFHDVDHPTVLVRLETTRWTELERIELPDSARINALAWPTDGVLVCGENDGQISLREASTGKILGRHFAHNTGDVQLDVSVDGRRWSSLGKTALVWESAKLPKPQADPDDNRMGD
jgi:WD40 repeat protein